MENKDGETPVCATRAGLLAGPSAGDKPQPYVFLGSLSAVQPESVFVPMNLTELVPLSLNSYLRGRRASC